MITLFISGAEILLVLFFILIFFGSKSIPDIAKVMGKGMREFNKATQDIKRELDNTTNDVKKSIDDVKHNIEKDADVAKATDNKQIERIE
jgi:sec-independent protein translocase protein TatA